MTARIFLFPTVLLCLVVGLACNSAEQTRSTNQNVASSPASSPVVTRASEQQTVEIRSADDVVLVGTFLAADKPDSPALLLLHQWASDRHSYDEFAKRLNEKGFAVLSIDGRGFGESTKKADGSRVAAGRTDADVKAMLGDVDVALQFLKRQKNVDSSKIGVVGASYGSSLALIYAADHPNVAAVALLSPGLNYFGNMPTEPAVEQYYSSGRPIFFAAAKDDPESYKTVTRLASAMPKDYPGTSFQAEKGGHGTELFKVGLGNTLDEFLSSKLQK